MPTYRITRQADVDLKAIYRYTRRTWGKAQAAHYASQLHQRCRMLTKNSHAGIRRNELSPKDLNSFVHGSHVIFYQTQPYAVLIVRVLHGSQDGRRHLGSREEP